MQPVQHLERIGVDLLAGDRVLGPRQDDGIAHRAPFYQSEARATIRPMRWSRRSGRAKAGITAGVLALALATAMPAAAADPPLARARAAYNAGDFEAAIGAAAEARKQPATADAAAVVLARAFLERYRATASPPDLSSARDALRGVVRVRLSPRDQVDQLVAVGQVLFFDEAFGAAAELFDSALSLASILPPHDRVWLLEWWTSALDREAQSRPAERRAAIYQRIASRMEQELESDPAAAAPNYWLAAALRGTGDLERAWDAAAAGWVRLTLAGAGTGDSDLRADIDRLVTQALITERARQRPPREQADAAAALRAEWEGLKSQWN
jgi:hypothetical protein